MIAVIAFGLNDQKRREPHWRQPRSWRRPVAVPVEQFRENITLTAARIRRRSGADVVLVSPCPLPRHEENEHYHAALVDIAERTEFVLADVTAAWPAESTELLAPDGLHPSEAGHRVYAETLCGVGL